MRFRGTGPPIPGREDQPASGTQKAASPMASVPASAFSLSAATEHLLGTGSAGEVGSLSSRSTAPTRDR